ncbi:MAG: phosphatase PAP2 family protein [Armatimonadetes bacterium]|nr:phosphatase PAP2 family protein [Armatimonadota bacterium]
MSIHIPLCTIGPESWNAALTKFDIGAFKLINSGLASPVMDHIMVAATLAGGGACQSIMCLGFAIFGWRMRKPDWLRAGLAGLLAAIMSTIVVQIFKIIFNRPRPLLAMFDVRIPDKALFGPSFPSGHTMTVFAIAFACSMCVPKLRYILIPFALLTGFSRIYVGVHFPLDVMYGGLVGAFLGLAAAAIVKRKSSTKNQPTPNETEAE